MVFFWKLVLNIFFRNIQAIGEEKLPKDCPMLFVSNHTNAILDPFVILAALQKPIVPTAKFTLLKNPLLWCLLKSHRAIMFNRSQDKSNMQSLRLNIASFKECVKVFMRNEHLCIFPEGQSHSEIKMLPFKTGAARIALMYHKENPSGKPLKIVPVGLFYDEKHKFRSRVAVQIGDVLDVSEWVRSNTGQGPKELTIEIEKMVEDVVLTFEQTRDSVIVPWVADLLLGKGKYPARIGEKDPFPDNYISTVKRLEKEYSNLRDKQEIKELEDDIVKLRQNLHANGLNLNEIHLPINIAKALFFVFREVEILVGGFGLFLLGRLIHFCPLNILIQIVNKYSIDEDHWATNYVLFGMVEFFIFYLIVAISLAFVNLYLFAMSLVILPYLGYFSILYAERAKKSIKRTKTFFLFLFNKKLQEELCTQTEDIVKSIENIRKSYLS